jgi:predicted RNase H-like nuclease (RuvC/YqgF family)
MRNQRIEELESEVEKLTDAAKNYAAAAMAKQQENERLRDALKEIRDVAACSEGVEFYAMLADNALEGKT